MSQAPEMKIKALAPWFGGCRSIADRIGPELGKLDWCGVLFAGGMPELPHIKTQAGVAVDLHRHIINLARVVADDALLVRMIRSVDRLLFHTDVIAAAQHRCLNREHEAGGGLFANGGAASTEPDVEWAADYFVCCWMGRGGYAGRGGELSQSIAVRYTARGGSSATRWRSAVESLPAWGKTLGRWQFVCEDAFKLVGRLKPLDAKDTKRPGKAGIYADPPWVGAGDEYVHRMTTAQHRKLAAELARLSDGGYRVVVRYGDDALIRALYPSPRWTWIETSTKNQLNGDVSEVMILSGPSFMGGPHS